MKSLPTEVAAFKRTETFTESTIPNGLLSAHQTKAGTWGKIVIENGELLYRILEPSIQDHTLSADRPGVIEPTTRHEVKPLGEVSFFVEFYR